MQPMIPGANPLTGVEDVTDTRDDAPALTALYNRTVDSLKGYETMLEKAQPQFRDTVERFRSMHAEHARILASLLSDTGVMVDSDGTLMGTVNKTVVTLRAFFDDIDEDVMKQIRDGEDWVLTAFDNAITENAGSGQLEDLRRMRTDLTDLLAETRHLG